MKRCNSDTNHKDTSNKSNKKRSNANTHEQSKGIEEKDRKLPKKIQKSSLGLGITESSRDVNDQSCLSTMNLTGSSNHTSLLETDSRVDVCNAVASIAHSQLDTALATSSSVRALLFHLQSQQLTPSVASPIELQRREQLLRSNLSAQISHVSSQYQQLLFEQTARQRQLDYFQNQQQQQLLQLSRVIDPLQMYHFMHSSRSRSERLPASAFIANNSFVENTTQQRLQQLIQQSYQQKQEQKLQATRLAMQLSSVSATGLFGSAQPPDSFVTNIALEQQRFSEQSDVRLRTLIAANQSHPFDISGSFVAPQDLPSLNRQLIDFRSGIETASSQPQYLELPVHEISRGIPLDLPSDEYHLSSYQMLVRQQLEYFVSRKSDCDTDVQGRKKQVQLGQVGIRCRHCKYAPIKERGRGSVYYPTKLSGVYQAAQNMATTHLSNACTFLPIVIREQLILLHQRRDTAAGGKHFWAEACRSMGLVEGENGLCFCSDKDKKKEAHVDLSATQLVVDRRLQKGTEDGDNDEVSEHNIAADGS